MPDTGAPWNIPYVENADLVRDWPADSLLVANAVAAGLSAVDAGDVEVITATNATWPVPSLASPIVKVTVIGGGGGGGTGNQAGGTAGSNGGTSTFNAGGAGTVTAAGGTGGGQASVSGGANGPAGTAGFSAGNGGQPAVNGVLSSTYGSGSIGNGGAITVSYLDLTGISTVNVTIGAGGTGGTADTYGGFKLGGTGGRGEVIVEYKAA